MSARQPLDLPVHEVIASCHALAEEAFGPRLRGLYLLGSLAHGGFVPAVSDLGVALFLAAPLVAQDAEQIAAVTAYCDAAHPAYARRLSLFRGVIEDFADTDAMQIPRRFPALDRLDLIEHGRYVAGEELRAHLAPPSRAAVLENSRHDLPRFVRDPARYGFLTGGAALDTRDRRALTRFCLFPARFLHTARTGEVVSNEDAARSYCAAHEGAGSAIVRLALALRHEPMREVSAAERALLATGLRPYYGRFLREFLTLLGTPAPAPDATIPLLLAAIDEATVPDTVGHD
jgi:hypothetical protein